MNQIINSTTLLTTICNELNSRNVNLSKNFDKCAILCWRSLISNLARAKFLHYWAWTSGDFNQSGHLFTIWCYANQNVNLYYFRFRRYFVLCGRICLRRFEILLSINVIHNFFAKKLSKKSLEIQTGLWTNFPPEENVYKCCI